MAQKYVAYVGSYTYYGSSKGISIMDVGHLYKAKGSFCQQFFLSCCFPQ